jgi:Cys-rich repeat protein
VELSVPARAQGPVVARAASRRLRWAAVYALLMACGPGPTVYLGSLGAKDAGIEEAGTKDAGKDDDDDDDDDDVPCDSDDVCRGSKEPYCHPEREVCVECLRDEHCPSGEHCEKDGDCDN